MRAGFTVKLFNALMLSLVVTGSQLAALGQSTTGASGARDAYRVAHQFADAGAAGTFIEMLSRKEVIAVQMEVISQLAEEKRAELQAFNRELKEIFELDPDLDYSFDTDTGRVFAAAPDHHDPSAARPAPALILKDENRKQQFTKLALARNATKQQILSFNLLRSEKTLEMQATDRALASAYGVTTNGTFRYDADNLTLYEKVETP